MTLIYSCSNNHGTHPINSKVLNDSLINSNKTLKRQNDSLYKIMEMKLADEKTSQIAVLWFPKAKYLQYRSDEIYKYLDTIISNLKSDSILNVDSLYAKLDFYKGNILRIDPDIYNNIKYSSEIITHYFDSVKLSKKEQLNLYFSDKSKDEQLLILNRTKNNIEIIENKTLLFCNKNIE